MTATEQQPTPPAAGWRAPLPRSLDFPAVPVGSVLRAAVRRWGDRTAFADHDVPLTYTELGARAHAVANWLADHGVGRGDVVAVHIPNCRQYPAVYYGVLLAGATFSPTNPLLPAADLAAQLTDAGARVLVTWDQVLPLVRTALAATPVQAVVVTGESHTLDLGARLELEPGDVDLADLVAGDPTDRHLDADVDPAAELAHLAYTGGTTGVSKGVELPHRAVVTNVLQSACWSSGSVPDLDEAGDVTLLQVPGFLEADWSGVRGVSSGAAPLPVTLIERLQQVLPNAVIGEGYGLTEVTMQATGNPVYRSGTRKPGTVGVPIFDTEISIQPLGGGAPLPPGERGEGCIRGPQVMRGYAHRPEATADAIDPDGWFHTGDVGILDDDGYLAIVDRTKDMLLYKGYNVFPRELEEILFGLPGVAGAAVVGRPDEEAGELPVAYVVRKADDAGAALTAESVMAAVNDRVTPYKRLRDVVFIDAIPVSAAGKVLKRELAARERAAVTGGRSPPRPAA